MTLWKSLALLLLLAIAVVVVVQAHSTDLPGECSEEGVGNCREESLPPRMKEWPAGLRYPSCERLFSEDEQDQLYMKKTATQPRLKVTDGMFDFSTTCPDIRSRGYYSDQPLSQKEAEFPIAYANIVYKDYILHEKILQAIYTPQNFYCYALDQKAPEMFKKRMRDLANCFPNVMVPDEEFAVTSGGVNVSSAHLSCMQELRKMGDWKYVLLLQNHDIPLKTNAELVDILSIFDGTNDISTYKVQPTSLDWEANRTLANLHLYRNETLNRRLVHGKLPRLRPTKSLVGVSVSREFANFVLDDLDVNGFVEQLENVASQYGMDENLLSTLNSNDMLKAPGGFTRACIDRGIPVSAISRYAIWSSQGKDCGSKRFRHSVCVFGVEDLQRLSKLPHLFANKMMPSFDFGAVSCWLERLYNRTHFENPAPVDEDFYSTLPQVRYNRLKNALMPGEILNRYAFDCSHPYSNPDAPFGSPSPDLE